MLCILISFTKENSISEIPHEMHVNVKMRICNGIFSKKWRQNTLISREAFDESVIEDNNFQRFDFEFTKLKTQNLTNENYASIISTCKQQTSPIDRNNIP